MSEERKENSAIIGRMNKIPLWRGPDSNYDVKLNSSELAHAITNRRYERPLLAKYDRACLIIIFLGQNYSELNDWTDPGKAVNLIAEGSRKNILLRSLASLSRYVLIWDQKSADFPTDYNSLFLYVHGKINDIVGAVELRSTRTYLNLDDALLYLAKGIKDGMCSPLGPSTTYETLKLAAHADPLVLDTRVVIEWIKGATRLPKTEEYNNLLYLTVLKTCLHYGLSTAITFLGWLRIAGGGGLIRGWHIGALRPERIGELQKTLLTKCSSVPVVLGAQLLRVDFGRVATPAIIKTRGEEVAYRRELQKLVQKKALTPEQQVSILSAEVFNLGNGVKFDEMSAQIKQWKAKSDTYQALADSRKDAAVDAKTECAEEISLLKAENLSLRKQFQDAVDNMGSCTASMREMQTTIEALKAIKLGEEHMETETSAELMKLREEQTKLWEKFNQKAAENKLLEAEVTKLREAESKGDPQLDQILKDCQKRNAELAKRATNSHLENSSLHGTISTLKGTLEAMKETVTRLEAANQTLRTETETGVLQNRLIKLQELSNSKMQVMQAKVDQAVAETERFDSALLEAKRKEVSYQKNIKELRAQIASQSTVGEERSIPQAKQDRSMVRRQRQEDFVELFPEAKRSLHVPTTLPPKTETIFSFVPPSFDSGFSFASDYDPSEI